jgi:hypothetical protein
VEKKMSRRVKRNGVQEKFAFNKNKKYKWDKKGDLVEATIIGDNDIVISGSKSSLRRMADMERNISILATTLTTSDDGVDDTADDTFDTKVNKKTRFKKEVRFSADVDIDSNDNLNIGGSLTLGGSAQGTINSMIDSKISATVDGAPAAMNTLNELAAALGDDANYAASITSALAGKVDDSQVQTNVPTGAKFTDTTYTFTAGNNVSLTQNGTNVTITSTDTNTNTNSFITAMNFNTSNGVLTATRSDGGQVTVDLDGRFTDNGYADTMNQHTKTNSNVNFNTVVAAGDITAYSDERLKENVQVIDNAMDKVQAVSGITFTRKADGSTSTGVTAQELQAVLPEAVKVDENGLLSVAYGNVVGLLIEAVKELKADIDSLKK